ncbi:DUF2059 domain-containing protein [Phenylobacterium sp. J367]|uniref:DUF2059 domain-containing protein n=1 Tax=Phenylobacterium sp. J367 TaxID=2898435 RepID=UPI002151CCD6|nr:DUF2059 domain-containing protein [Phenylobacterium sp. J367]MCR5878292.1 DUF2059 domain-containing protein [Phenylobacterium sp. J367]
MDRPQRGVEPATRAAAAAAIRKSQGQATAETEEGMARILASRLSAADLEKAAAFLASPEGQRYLSFPDGLAAAQSAITAEARRRMETTARDTFCARLNCKAEPATEVLKAAMAADPPPEPVIVWDRRPTPDALGAPGRWRGIST